MEREVVEGRWALPTSAINRELRRRKGPPVCVGRRAWDRRSPGIAQVLCYSLVGIAPGHLLEA